MTKFRSLLKSSIEINWNFVQNVVVLCLINF